MKFGADWKSVLRHAWSVRLMLISGLLSVLEVVVPYLPVLIDIPSGLLAALSGLAALAATIARFVVQKKLTKGDGQ